MKTETLELIIEELASALSLERWRSATAEAESAKLKAEIAELKSLLDSKCEGCAGRIGINGEQI